MVFGIGRRIGLGGLVVGHALLEGLDALRDVAHQLGNLAAPEQQQDHGDHHDPVPDTQRTHRKSSAPTGGTPPPRFGPNLGARGAKTRTTGPRCGRAATWLRRSNRSQAGRRIQRFIAATRSVARPRRRRLFLDALRRRREAEVEIARLERVLVVAQRRIVGRHRHREARRQAVVEQARAFQLLQARQIAQLPPARNATGSPRSCRR